MARLDAPPKSRNSLGEISPKPVLPTSVHSPSACGENTDEMRRFRCRDFRRNSAKK